MSDIKDIENAKTEPPPSETEPRIEAGAEYEIPDFPADEHDLNLWFQTYTGLRLNPFTMQPCDVRIEDIAHALSMICRFGGHCARFFSVAEHSVNVSHDARLQTDDARRVALAHDYSEAYLGDMIRPLKKASFFAAFSAIEHRVQRVINVAFGIEKEARFYESVVKLADDLMLSSEAACLMVDTDDWGLMQDPVKLKAPGLSPEGAEISLFVRHRDLFSRMQTDADRGMMF